MLDIDFLPAQYRRRRASQQATPWRAIVILAFFGLVGVAAFGQFRQHAALRAELEMIEPQYDQAARTSAQLGSLQDELKHARAAAELLTYLRHPWPRTQLLDALLRPLPDQIVLLELEMGTEVPALRRPRDRGRPPGGGDDSQADAALTPAERDLANLREQYDDLRTVIRFTGATDDSAALHRYLGALARAKLFRSAELESIESIDGAGGAVRFSAVVSVRPGYGLPGGPAGPEPDALAGHLTQ